MRYKLKGGIEIRSENAAKPESQQSNYLRELISGLPLSNATFDYGCGKLRYQKAISQTTNFLTLVDSDVQLTRQQHLRGKKTSVREVFKGSNQVEVLNDKEFEISSDVYDRGFCINVLSVIPSYTHRMRVLSTIRQHLKRSGECLFTVQYRNSDFKRMAKMRNAKPYLDGFLIESLRGHSFYGLIRPERLEKSLCRAGFRVRETKLHEGSAYTWAALA